MLFYGTLYAEGLATYEPQLDADQIDTLQAGKLLASSSEKAEALEFYPQGTMISEKVRVLPIEKDTLFVECLTLIPYPDYFSSLSDEERMLHMFNTLRSVSTQEGITYISHRKGDKPAVLITTSHFTSRIGSREVLDDLVSTAILRDDMQIVYQDDTSFRKNYYEYHYVTSDDEILVEITNKTTMRVFGILPAVKKDVLKISIAMIPTDEGILAYSLSLAPHQRPEIRVLGFSVHLPSAFERRMVAVQDWFADQLYTTRTPLQ